MIPINDSAIRAVYLQLIGLKSDYKAVKCLKCGPKCEGKCRDTLDGKSETK